MSSSPPSTPPRPPALPAWRRALVTASWASRKQAASTDGPVEVAADRHRHPGPLSPPWRSRRDRSVDSCCGRRSVRSSRSAPTTERGSSSPRGLLLDHLQGLERPVRSGDKATTRPAWACTAMAETWWATVSCSCGQLCPPRGIAGPRPLRRAAQPSSARRRRSRRRAAPRGCRRARSRTGRRRRPTARSGPPRRAGRSRRQSPDAHRASAYGVRA